MQQATCLFVGWVVDDAASAGFLVDEVPPQALQEALRANDGTGLPGSRGVERTRGHLVQTEGVGSVGVAISSGETMFFRLLPIFP